MTRLTLVCLILVGSGAVACGGGSSAPSCADPVPATTVHLADFAFDPGCAAAGTGATLTIVNDGGAPHSYTVKGTSLNVQVDAGQTQTVELTGIVAGTYSVICTYHPQMNGALKIG